VQDGPVDQVDRDELGAFLRRHRERVQPGDVGLPVSGRRRTPGLRRQEVAQLAGMSIDYYIQLEQARGPRPSAQILSAVGRALRMSDEERGYLAELAGVELRRPDSVEREVRPGLLHVLDQLAAAPALVCSATFDVLAWNPMAAALLPGLIAQPDGERNVILRHFSQPAAGERLDPEDRLRFGRELVAQLRLAVARYRGDAAATQLVSRLRQHSDDFRRLWDEQDVAWTQSTTKRDQSPSARADRIGLRGAARSGS